MFQQAGFKNVTIHRMDLHFNETVFALTFVARKEIKSQTTFLVELILENTNLSLVTVLCMLVALVSWNTKMMSQFGHQKN